MEYVKLKYITSNLTIEAEVPVNGSKVYLITGKEDLGFHLIGGIIAGLFPLKGEIVNLPQFGALIEQYNGQIIIEQGELPQSVAYIDVDPDRNLFFSKVKEEIMVQLNNPTQQELENVLTKFGLDRSFLERHIHNLSGGEKVKVALAIAFSLDYSCYVLHGVVPWLDKKGREFLKNEVNSAKKKGKCIIFLEHEFSSLKNIIDEVFIYNGKTIQRSEREYIFIDPKLQEKLQVFSMLKLKEQSMSCDPVLEFEGVTLHNYPYPEAVRENPLLNGVSFKLNFGDFYTLIGENGAGKSTIARLAIKVLKPDNGTIKFCGNPIQYLDRRKLVNQICYISQFPEQQVTLSTIGQYREKVISKDCKLKQRLFDKYFQNFINEHPVSSLTVFDIKLLLLITFITNETKLIILDEPTWGLDAEQQFVIFEVLEDIFKQLSITLLIITHNLTLVSLLNSKILWLKDGEILSFENIDALKKYNSVSSYFDFA